MAALKEHLCTKDNAFLDALYRKMKHYMETELPLIPVCESDVREERIDWLTSFILQESVLKAILRSADLHEFQFLEKVYLNEGNLHTFSGKNMYWEEFGLLCVNEEASGLRSFCIADELAAWIEKERSRFFFTLHDISLANSLICAMTNLYGVIPFAKAAEIYKGINLESKLEGTVFLETTARFLSFRQDRSVLVYNKQFVAADYLRVVQKGGNRHIYPQPSYYELISRQGDKAYYTNLSAAEFLEYEDPEHVPFHAYMKEFADFLKKMPGVTMRESRCTAERVGLACRSEQGINDIFAMLTSAGYVPLSQKGQKLMVSHIMNIKNNVRLRINRGYTINEMRVICYNSHMICSNL